MGEGVGCDSVKWARNMLIHSCNLNNYVLGIFVIHVQYTQLHIYVYCYIHIIIITLRLQLIAGTNFSVFAPTVFAYTNFSDLCLHDVIKISVCTIMYDDDIY